MSDGTILLSNPVSYSLRKFLGIVFPNLSSNTSDTTRVGAAGICIMRVVKGRTLAFPSGILFILTNFA